MTLLNGSSRALRAALPSFACVLTLAASAPAVVKAQTLAQEPARTPVASECRICLVTYVHNPVYPNGQQMIREDCDFSPTTVAAMRQLQLQIATQGTYSFLSLEDWGTWYGPHRIESVRPVLLPPCY
jgi:hypothetical protein